MASPQVKWFYGMEKDEKERFEQSLDVSRHTLKRLYEIIESMEKELDQSELSLSEYESPAFPYLKADRIGERRGYYKIKQLLQFVKD